MAGRLITEFNDAGNLLPGDFIPIARNTTTLKLSAIQLVTRDLNGNIILGSGINTGNGATTEDCKIELGSLRTATGHSYIDLHSNPNRDYDARLARWSGINGGLTLINTGTGNFDLWQTGAGNINLATSNTTRVTITSAGYIGFGTALPDRALYITGDEGVKSDIVLEAIQPPTYTGPAGPSFIFQHKGNVGYAKTGDIISQISARGYSTAIGQIGYQSAGEIQIIAAGNFNAAATRSADMTFATSHNGTFTEKLRIKSDGRIGIGTTNPVGTLDIQPGLLTLGRTDTNSEGGELRFCRAGDNTAVWSIDQIGTGTSTSGSLRFFNTQTGTLRMLINEVGNVGIGVNNPTTKLDVDGSGNILRLSGRTGLFQGMVIKTADSSASVERTAFWDHQNENEIPTSSIHSRVYPNGSSELYFHTTSSGVRTQDRRIERMRLKSDGKVHIPGSLGIGTDNPLTTLDVRGLITIGPSQGIQTSADNSNVYIAGGSYWNKGAVINLNGPNNTGSMIFSTGTGATNTEKMRLDANGNLGIGTNSPASKLHVAGTILTNEELRITNTSSANQARFVHGNYGVIARNDGSNFYLLATNSNDQYGFWNSLRPFGFNLANGRVFIGGFVDDNPYELNVAGNVYASGWLRTRGNNGWYSESWGGGWHMTDNTWIRAYGNKRVWSDNVIGTNGGLTIGYNGQDPTGGGLSVRENVGIGLGTQISIAQPAVKLHVKTNIDEIARFEGSNGTNRHTGIVLKVANASSNDYKIGYFDFQNEFGMPSSSMHNIFYANGASDLYFHTTPAGSRGSDRRQERLRLKSDGNVIIPNNLGIGTDNPLAKLDVRGGIAISPSNGIQTTVDNANTYIAGGSTWNKGASITLFGSDNSGSILFSTGTGATNAGRMRLLADGTLGLGEEIQIANTSSGNQVRLVQGNYGLIFRNDGSNFYLLPTNSGNQYGSWNELRPFVINMATGGIYMNNVQATNVQSSSFKSDSGTPAAGSSSVGYSFNSSQTTGLFSPNTGAISLYANGQKTFESTNTNTTVYGNVVLDSGPSTLGAVFKTFGGLKCHSSIKYATGLANTTRTTPFSSIFPSTFMECLANQNTSNVIEVKLLNNYTETTTSTNAQIVKRGSTFATVVVDWYKNAQGKIGYTINGAAFKNLTDTFGQGQPTGIGSTGWATLSATRETTTRDGGLFLVQRSHNTTNASGKIYTSNTQIFFEGFASYDTLSTPSTIVTIDIVAETASTYASSNNGYVTVNVAGSSPSYTVTCTGKPSVGLTNGQTATFTSYDSSVNVTITVATSIGTYTFGPYPIGYNTATKTYTFEVQ